MRKRSLLFLIIITMLACSNIFAALTITKSVSRINAAMGSTLTYIINYSNAGAAPVTNVRVWDTIPVEAAMSMHFLSATSGTESSGVLTHTIPTLAAGDSGSITIVAYADISMNTITANVRNTAFIEGDGEPVVMSNPVHTTFVKTSLGDEEYVTFGAWEDFDQKNMGFIHIYTLSDGANVRLYSQDAEQTSISTITSVNGATTYPAGSVIDFPNDNPNFNFVVGDNATSNGLNETPGHNTRSRYFKLVSNKPILWMFDAIYDDLWSDAQIFCMSTDYKFSGSTFFTHLYKDRNPYNSSSHQNDADYGEGMAIVNPNNFRIAAYVYNSTDNGVNWYFKVSATVAADTAGTSAGPGGIWYYGGATNATEGDFKVVIRGLDASGNDTGDARAIMWKGNVFAGKSKPCANCVSGDPGYTNRDADHDNNNSFFISVDGNKVSKAGNDVMYGCMTNAWDPTSGRGEIVVTNTSATPATYQLFRYVSTNSGLRDPVPQSGGAFGSAGNWVAWGVPQTVLGNASNTLTVGNALEYGSYVKIVLTSGGPIQAIGGSNILAALYGQADYLEAADTNICVGQDFYFGNSSWAGYGGDWWKKNEGAIFIALCPIAGTTVTITQGTLAANVDIGYNNTRTNPATGIAYPPSSPLSQTTTGPDQALKFFSIKNNTYYRIQSTEKIFLMVQNLKGREKVFSGVAVRHEYLYPSASLDKTVSPSTGSTGDSITYTITFDNSAGLGAAHNLEIVDTLPAGISLTSHTEPAGWTFSQSGNLVRFSSGSSIVAAGGSAVFTVTANVTSTGTGTILNNAKSYFTDSLNTPQMPKTSPDAVFILANVPVFSFSKSASPTSAAHDATVTYTINYSNNGLADATDIRIWDTIPSEMTYVPGSASGGGTESSGVVTWTIPGPFAVSASGSVNFAAYLASDVKAGLTKTNTVNLTCAERTNTYTATADVTTLGPVLSLTKSVSPASAAPGSTVTYTMTVNVTGTNATGISVWDTLPPGLNYVSGGTYNAGTRVVDMSIASIAAGGNASVSFLASVDTSLQGGATVLNTASVTCPQTVLVTQSAQTTLNVVGPSFNLIKSVNPAKGEAGITVTYMISYTNNGLAAGTGVMLWDTVPSLHNYISCSGGSGCSYDTLSRIVTWPIPGTVAVGDNGTVSFVAEVDSSAGRGDRIKNTAMASANEMTNKNTSNQSDFEVQVPELVLKAEVTVPNPTDGPTTIVYTLSVKADVTIKIFTVSGELIRTIKDIKGVKGTNRTLWDANNEYNQKAASGVYIYKIEAVSGPEKKYVFSKLAVTR